MKTLKDLQIKLLISTILYILSMFTYITPIVFTLFMSTMYYICKCIDTTIMINKKGDKKYAI